MTARDFLREWLAGLEGCLQRSTWEAMTVYVEKHLLPYFGAYALQDITPALCQRYVSEKLRNGRADGKGGLSAVSVRKHISVLKQAMNFAVCTGQVPYNPVSCVRMPRRRGTVAHRTVFLTSEEAVAVLTALRTSPLYPVVAITLYYGLRRSEVLGLRWQSVDFRRNTLTIEHTVVKNITTEAKDATKTQSSRRTFALLPEIREMLAELKKTAQGGVYVFTRENGHPLRPDCLTRGFQRALRRAGLPVMRFHDLRHSTASILFERGWALEDVKNGLGHADIETTSNIYLHYSQSRKVLLAEGLEGMLIKAKKP